MEQKKFKLIKHESNNYGYIVDENDVYIQVHAYVIQYIESLQKELDETKLELLKEKENHEIDLQNWSNDLKELEPTYNENEKLKNEIEGLDIEVEFLKDENKELKEAISKMETTTSKWISVKDRLPTSDTTQYLVYNETTKEYGESFFSLILRCFQFDVTHWMPLPPPPTTEEI